MSNEIFQALPVIALIVEATVLGWALRRADAAPMIIFNGVAAIGLAIPLVFALAAGPDRWAAGLYGAMIVLFAFQLATLATSLACALHPDSALRVLASVEFAAYGLLTLAAAVFALTFRVNLEL
jgi:hypothetical protein